MTSLHTRLAGLVAATLVAAAGLIGLSSAPAAAAYCANKGASAAVDFNDGAGGGIKTGCAPNGGGASASSIFKAAGFTMERNPDGSVCKVNGEPEAAQCQRLGSQYWALYWSDGKSGWKYSQLGADGLNIPEGGTVAWAWESGSGSSAPGVAPARPVARTPTPTKTPKPTKPPKASKPTKATEAPKPTKAPKATKPTRTPVTSSASTTAPRAKASAPARASATASPSASPSASASASASTLLEPDATGGATPEADSLEQADGAFAPEDEPSGLPAWVPITVIVALAGAAGGVVWWRRRTGAA